MTDEEWIGMRDYIDTIRKHMQLAVRYADTALFDIETRNEAATKQSVGLIFGELEKLGEKMKNIT